MRVKHTDGCCYYNNNKGLSTVSLGKIYGKKHVIRFAMPTHMSHKIILNKQAVSGYFTCCA